jgi:hypothetical protein
MAGAWMWPLKRIGSLYGFDFTQTWEGDLKNAKSFDFVSNLTT